MPSIDTGRVLLVGSVARPLDGWSVEQVLRRCADALGEHASMLPDGEIGARSQWVRFITRNTYTPHPDLVGVRSHPVADPAFTGDHDWGLFSLRDGVDSIRFDRLGYADEALASYEIFARLRDDEGVIPRGTRFMVALPLIESATRRFIDSTPGFEILWAAYADVLARELAQITDAIPHEDLAIQFDMVMEVSAIEGTPPPLDPMRTLPDDPIERLKVSVARVSAEVPADVFMGLHACYGSQGHKPGQASDAAHSQKLDTLAAAVRLFNNAAQVSLRPLSFVHMPVDLTNGTEDRVYEPLQDLNVGDARVYLGLVHLQDGAPGARRRIDVARRHLADFGIATPCGWGRRPPDQRIEDLLALEAQVADDMQATPV